MASFDPKTVTPTPVGRAGTAEVSLWPDAGLVAQIRREITLGASRQTENYFPLCRQQLLNVLSALSGVDAQVLQLIDGLRVCLGNIDISDYREALQRLDKPDRTEQENRAFVGYQEEIATVLMQAMGEARQYVDALDGSLQILASRPIELNQPLIFQLESRLGNDPAGRPGALMPGLLEELKGPRQVAFARDGYVHEIRKLTLALAYFFDNVLKGPLNTIKGAEEFTRHAGTVLTGLQRLRDNWES